jgi:predicted membrane channel-forming protein YqfA (hemolysin III family)
MKTKIIFLVLGFLSMCVTLYYCETKQINYQIHWTVLSIVFYMFSGLVYLEEQINKKK